MLVTEKMLGVLANVKRIMRCGGKKTLNFKKWAQRSMKKEYSWTMSEKDMM